MLGGGIGMVGIIEPGEFEFYTPCIFVKIAR